MKHSSKAARQHGLSAAASEFQPALDAAVADAASLHGNDGAHARRASGGAALDGCTGPAAPQGCPDEAYKLYGPGGEADSYQDCGGGANANSVADERDMDDGRSDRVRLGSAARRCVTTPRRRAVRAARRRAAKP